MDEQQLAVFREQLLCLKDELEKLDDVSASASTPVVLDQTAVGRLSRMDAMQMQQMAVEARSRRQRQLANIRHALHLMGSGEYGYCESCGETIPNGRLAFDPSCRYCVNCAD